MPADHQGTAPRAAHRPPARARRRFVDWLLGTSVGGLLLSVLYPVARYLSPPLAAEAATAEVAAGPANDPELLRRGFKIVPFGSDPVILLRVSDTDFRAFSATCTHLDCIVEYRPAQQVIWCNCHNGQYDLTGRNIAGPPPRPLDAYHVHVVDEGPGKPASLVVRKA